jgi:hypothetical protein
MVEATCSNYKVGSLAITSGPHQDAPWSGHSFRRCSPPLLSLFMFHLASSVPRALFARRPPRQVVLHFLLPSPPIFSFLFPPLFPPQSKNKTESKFISPLGHHYPHSPHLSQLLHWYSQPPFHWEHLGLPCPIAPHLSPRLLPSSSASMLPLLPSLPFSWSLVLL